MVPVGRSLLCRGRRAPLHAVLRAERGINSCALTRSACCRHRRRQFRVHRKSGGRAFSGSRHYKMLKSGLSLLPPVYQALLVQRPPKKEGHACGQRTSLGWPWAGPFIFFLACHLGLPHPRWVGRGGGAQFCQDRRAVNDRAVAWPWLVP